MRIAGQKPTTMATIAAPREMPGDEPPAPACAAARATEAETQRRRASAAATKTIEIASNIGVNQRAGRHALGKGQRHAERKAQAEIAHRSGLARRDGPAQAENQARSPTIGQRLVADRERGSSGDAGRRSRRADGCSAAMAQSSITRLSRICAE